MLVEQIAQLRTRGGPKVVVVSYRLPHPMSTRDRSFPVPEGAGDDRGSKANVAPPARWVKRF